MDLINETAAEISSSDANGLVKTYLPRMAETGNVPRNEKKFKNFISNSLRVSKVTSRISHWWGSEERREGISRAFGTIFHTFLTNVFSSTAASTCGSRSTVAILEKSDGCCQGR